MTSVDFMIALTVSPTLRFSSSTEFEVITEVIFAGVVISTSMDVSIVSFVSFVIFPFN